MIKCQNKGIFEVIGKARTRDDYEEIPMGGDNLTCVSRIKES